MQQVKCASLSMFLARKALILVILLRQNWIKILLDHGSKRTLSVFVLFLTIRSCTVVAVTILRREKIPSIISSPSLSAWQNSHCLGNEPFVMSEWTLEPHVHLPRAGCSNSQLGSDSAPSCSLPSSKHVEGPAKCHSWQKTANRGLKSCSLEFQKVLYCCMGPLNYQRPAFNA